jgi:hypothetical protein
VSLALYKVRKPVLGGIKLDVALSPLLEAVGTCSPRQVDPTGEWKECEQGLTRDGNCSVNPASQGHCTRVFIGARVSNFPM